MNYQQAVKMASKKRHKGSEGVPSASSLYRLEKCPASFKLSQGIPSRSSEYALQGTIDHFLQELNEAPIDTPDDVYLRFWRAQEIRNHIVQELGFTKYGDEIYFETDHLTGSADTIFIKNNGLSEALILDYKFGIEPAKANLQMAAYAYLLFLRKDQVKKIYTGVIQPQVTDNVKLTTWERGEPDKIILPILEEAKKEDAELNYNMDHCRYCPSFGSCKKTQFNLNLWI